MTQANQFSSHAALINAVQDGYFAKGRRITQATIDGQKLWIKRPENLGWRMYLQKGNAAKSFAKEQAAHLKLEHMGLPVPKIIAHGPDFTISADAGQDLQHLYHALSPVTFATCLENAAKALAQLHNAGVYHGRPSLKDISWNGSQINFMDFERANAHSNPIKGMAQDLLIFVFNNFSVAQGPCPALAQALAAYQALTPPTIWSRAVNMAHNYRWLVPATWPIRQMRKAWEFKAIPPTLAVFTKS